MTYQEAIEACPQLEHMGAIDLATFRVNALAADDTEFVAQIDAVMKHRQEEGA